MMFYLDDSTFMGREPALTVADPELVKDIMIKDFNVFINRRDMGSMDEILDHALTAVKDDDWKRLRSIVSHLDTYCINCSLILILF